MSMADAERLRRQNMSDLIEELKNEHRIILAVLSEVKALGITSIKGQQKLLSARDLLVSHMHKEDEQYYPAFRTAAENNHDLKIMLDYFVQDMEVVSNKAMHVFNKYAQGGDETDFTGDVKILYMTLKDRIHTEEEVLFKKFNPPVN
jgi:iron-sulfur cluster repair protein YtfE (RIC family)